MASDTWAECRPCGHRWVVVRVPIEVGAFGRALREARCPNCGSRSKDHLVYEPGRTPPAKGGTCSDG